MNTDIKNYINHINKANVGKKRTNSKVQADDVFSDITHASLILLQGLSDKTTKLKGMKLKIFIESLKYDFDTTIKDIKADKQFNDLTKTAKLYTIATISCCVDIINELIDYSTKNKTKNFSECIRYIKRNKIASGLGLDLESIEVSNKKPKKNAIEEREIYEEESEYESSDEEDEEDEDYGDNDNDDDDDDCDEDEEDNKSKLMNNKENRDFIEQVLRGREEDIETKILNYYTTLPKKDRVDALHNIKEIKDFQLGTKPIIFQIMELSLPVNQKNHILKNYTTLCNSRFPDNKLRNWFESLMTIPFDKYTGINLDSIKSTKVKEFLGNLQQTMDNAVYGHDDAKRQIIQMMGQQIRNPKSKGNMLGIWGPMGNGKTSLIKEGIAKAMDKPFVFISLGGATDSSFLEGHSYTYEGSVYGRIVNGLISSKCMDPIIYFDELDKISKTPKGEEITNILIHLTDPAQNSHFRDKYFHGVDIDLSRATMIFSFNDPENVNPILMDRITTVETKYLLTSQKIHIAKNYLLKEIMKDMGLERSDLVIEDKTLNTLIMGYTREGGVRKLKSLLYNIVRELNLANLQKENIDNIKVKFPFKVEERHLKILLKNKHEVEPDKIHTHDKVGVINGMWASTIGDGGCLPIHVLWIPSTTPFEVRATGNLQQVIKESTQVASTLAFNHLDEKFKNKYLSEWKKHSKGVHIHCPEGATPKDGPSAGCALTVCLYSLLTNRKIRHDIAITGEINLQGEVTAIGGLENKLEGSKRAGIKLALFPKENVKDIKKIKERNPKLFDDDFNAIPIETLDEALKYALV